jgi:hypothetical protein
VNERGVKPSAVEKSHDPLNSPAQGVADLRAGQEESWELERAYDEAKWVHEIIFEKYEKGLITLDTVYNLKFILAEAIEKMFLKNDPLILTANINSILAHLQDIILKR